MVRKIASVEFRERKHTKFAYRISGLDQYRAAFPLYYEFYSARRKAKLPPGWTTSNIAQLDADLIAFDRTGSAPRFLAHFSSLRKKNLWYNEKFSVIRQLLKDGIIKPTAVSAPLGAPATTDHGRDAAYHRDKKENDENYQIAQAIVIADWAERNKAERAEEDAIKIQDFILNSDNDLLTRFPTIDGLVDFLLHHCTFAEFPTSTEERAADALPFGAKTIHEAIQCGLQTPHFHFNFCVTTRDDTDGEWHEYLTGGSRNNIFHYAERPPGTPLRRGDVLDPENSDLQFIPMFRYHATEENGRDRIILEAETKCQSTYHQKVPVGTAGFRYDKAGRPMTKEDRVCTLYFVFSMRKFLEKVEGGTLKISPTKQPIQNIAHRFNFQLWDRSTWAPVVIP